MPTEVIVEVLAHYRDHGLNIDVEQSLGYHTLDVAFEICSTSYDGVADPMLGSKNVPIEYVYGDQAVVEGSLEDMLTAAFESRIEWTAVTFKHIRLEDLPEGNGAVFNEDGTIRSIVQFDPASVD